MSANHHIIRRQRKRLYSPERKRTRQNRTRKDEEYASEKSRREYARRDTRREYTRRDNEYYQRNTRRDRVLAARQNRHPARRRSARTRRAVLWRRLPGAVVRLLVVVALALIAFRAAEGLIFQAPEIPEPLAVRPGQNRTPDFDSNSNLHSDSNPALRLDPDPDPDLDSDFDFHSGSSPDMPEIQSDIKPRKDGFFTFLLSGVDDGNGGSDTIIIASLDTAGKQIYGLSVPRDTKAIVNGKAHKINAAYKSGGTELLARTISDQMGIPVDFTIEINLAGFAALIDALGGVDFDVPLDMDYDDPAQNLEIHIPAGFQHLDGATALKVVRFRHNNDGSGYITQDIGRIETQQKFLKAVAKKILSPVNLFKINSFARIFQKYVKTGLSFGNLTWLAGKAWEIGADGVSFSTLEGEWKSPFIYPDPEAALSVINGHLNPYQDPLTPRDLNFPS